MSTTGSGISDSTSSGISKIGDMAKGIHGIGEEIRGVFNKGVDDIAAEGLSGDGTGKDHNANDAKHAAILQNGQAVRLT